MTDSLCEEDLSTRPPVLRYAVSLYSVQLIVFEGEVANSSEHRVRRPSPRI